VNGLLDSIGGPARYYQTTLEPMQMLQAFRAGQPVVNHIFRPQAQFMPQGLPTYTPPPVAAPVSPFSPLGQQVNVGGLRPSGFGGGPGGDGAPGGVGTDGGADGSGGAGGGSK
jgi:uncharacterized membrane protein YgcG